MLISRAERSNEAGQVIGSSRRFNGGNADLGQSAWVFNGSNTVDVGLTGPEHTSSTGLKDSLGFHFNSSGQAAGESWRYNGGAIDQGKSAWVYNGTTTINVGLTDPEHTRNGGYRVSRMAGLNDAGQAIGESSRYNGTDTDLGQTAWLFDGTSTIDIGLTGPDFTAAEDFKYSEVWQLNQAGMVTGLSIRITDEGYGRAAWIYDGSTTTEIGLYGPEYTSLDGYFENTPWLLNEAGQVAGVAARYAAATQDNPSLEAWVFDPMLGTVCLQLSERDDGYAASSVGYLGEDGVVLGSYNLYSGMTLVGERAFYWSPQDGLWDLGSLVDGGLTANDWEALHYSATSNGGGQIIGLGLGAGIPLDSRSAYLLTPVPEPSTWALAGIGLLALAVFDRRLRVRRHRA